MQFGENGTIEYSLKSRNDKVFSLYVKLIRNLSYDTFIQLYEDAVNYIKNNNEDFNYKFTNLVVLCFLIRNNRGGKGERDLFYYFFEEISKTFPESSKSLIKLILHFGYGKDYFNLILRGHLSKNMVEEIFIFLSEQLSQDYNNMINSKNVSLLGKWMPRENKNFYKNINYVLHNTYKMNSIASNIIKRISYEYYYCVNGINTLNKYRRLITQLTKYIDVVESKMCANTWKDIDFNNVPSLALSKYKYAFDLSYSDNQIRNYEKYGKTYESDKEMSEENLEDRLICKDNYINFLVNGKVHGSQINIEKLVGNIMKIISSTNNDVSGSFDDLINRGLYDLALGHRQFYSYVDYVWQQLNDIKSEIKNRKNQNFDFSLDGTEIMIDVSSSMTGTPMNAAIGLGLLFMSLKQKENPDYDMSFLTFDTDPTYVSINECNTFIEMIKTVSSASWGGSTDFIKAYRRMLEKNGKDIKKAPKRILCLSDMQIDESSGKTNDLISVETMYESIVREFKEWYELSDDTMDLLPTIVFWDLRSNISGFPVNEYAKGVIQISGYSGSLLKMLLFGDELTTDPKGKSTAQDVLYKTLESKEYDVVRDALGWKDNNLNHNTTFMKECIKIISNTDSDFDSYSNSSLDSSDINTDEQTVKTIEYIDEDMEEENEGDMDKEDGEKEDGEKEDIDKEDKENKDTDEINYQNITKDEVLNSNSNNNIDKVKSESNGGMINYLASFIYRS